MRVRTTCFSTVGRCGVLRLVYALGSGTHASVDALTCVQAVFEEDENHVEFACARACGLRPLW